MTSQASNLLDTVDEMLLDAGQGQDTELRAALLSLGSLASVPAPTPNAQLAALLGSRTEELSWRRRLRRHRTTIVSLTVVAGMGLGVTGVAASASRPAEKASVSVQDLLEDWTPSWSLPGLPVAAPGTGLVLEPELEPELGPSGQDAAADPGAAGAVGAQQESPTGKVPDWAAAPDKSPGAAGKTGADDGGADARHAPGSAAPGSVAPGSVEAGTESAGTEAKVPAQAGTLPDTTEAVPTAEETARQALEKSGKLLSAVVPERAVPEEAASGEPRNEPAKKSGTLKNADPGAKWLKKFSR